MSEVNFATTEEFAEMFGKPLASPKSQVGDREYCEKLLKELNANKSAVIRYLTVEGWSRTRIAYGLNIRYQFVRNTQLRQLKK